MNLDGAVAEEAVVVAAAASSSALRCLMMVTSRWAVVHVMVLTGFFPGRPSVLMRASLLGLSAPSSRSRPSPSCASAWHNLSHDQEAAHDTYNVFTYASRMRCTMFVHHQDLFSIQEFRGCCKSGTCREESHAIETTVSGQNEAVQERDQHFASCTCSSADQRWQTRRLCWLRV